MPTFKELEELGREIAIEMHKAELRMAILATFKGKLEFLRHRLELEEEGEISASS